MAFLSIAMLNELYNLFMEVPKPLRVLAYVFAIVPMLLLIQIIILPISILIFEFDLVMNLIYRNDYSWEPDIIPYMAFFPLFLIKWFGETLLT